MRAASPAALAWRLCAMRQQSGHASSNGWDCLNQTEQSRSDRDGSVDPLWCTRTVDSCPLLSPSRRIQVEAAPRNGNFGGRDWPPKSAPRSLQRLKSQNRQHECPQNAGTSRRSPQIREWPECVVELVGTKLSAHHAVCRTSLPVPRNENFSARDRARISRRLVHGDHDVGGPVGKPRG